MNQRIWKSALALLLAVVVLATGLSGVASAAVAPAASYEPAATAVMSAVSMRAPVFNTYDHQTGGGAWNTGTTNLCEGRAARHQLSVR